MMGRRLFIYSKHRGSDMGRREPPTRNESPSATYATEGGTSRLVTFGTRIGCSNVGHVAGTCAASMTVSAATPARY